MNRIPESKRRIFIVDDHPIVTKALNEMLNAQDDLSVCGSADSQPDALVSIDRLNPDLVVIDLSLRVGNGMELLKDIKVRRSKTPVIILTVHDEEVYSSRAIRAGASGFVTKRESPDNVLRAIREVLAGGVYLNGRVAKKMLMEFSGRTENASAIDALTDRELEVLKLIGNGLSTSDIAEQIHVSIDTVHLYREQIRKKLKLSREELLPFAVEWNSKN